MLTYLDTNIVIYVVERASSFSADAEARVMGLRAEGRTMIASDLVRMETNIRPLATGDRELLEDYEAFYDSAVSVVGFTPSTFDLAARIRAQHRYRTIDALHLAAAIEAGCSLFLTNDTRLCSFPDLRVESLR